MTARIASAFAFVFVAAACGKAAITPPGNNSAEPFILRVETAGGLLAPEYAMRAMPEFELSSDGRAFTQGAQIEIYPPPALPPTIVAPITSAGIEAIRKAAEDAGLTGPDQTFAEPRVMDAGTTTFTYVDRNGNTHTVAAVALGMKSGSNSGERAKLAELRDKLGNLKSWMPAGSVGAEKSYKYETLRVLSHSYVKQQDQNLTQPPKTWPLATPLATFGAPMKDSPLGDGARCGAVQGTDAEKLREPIRTSNQATPWVSGGKTYGLIFRPVLPGEPGCPPEPSPEPSPSA